MFGRAAVNIREPEQYARRSVITRGIVGCTMQAARDEHARRQRMIRPGKDARFRPAQDRFHRLGRREAVLRLEGETTVENVRATRAMPQPPDGHGGIELEKLHTPDAIRLGPVHPPVNALGAPFAHPFRVAILNELRKEPVTPIAQLRRRVAVNYEEIDTRNIQFNLFRIRSPASSRRRARKGRRWRGC